MHRCCSGTFETWAVAECCKRVQNHRCKKCLRFQLVMPRLDKLPCSASCQGTTYSADSSRKHFCNPGWWKLVASIMASPLRCHSTVLKVTMSGFTSSSWVPPPFWAAGRPQLLQPLPPPLPLPACHPPKKFQADTP